MLDDNNLETFSKMTKKDVLVSFITYLTSIGLQMSLADIETQKPSKPSIFNNFSKRERLSNGLGILQAGPMGMLLGFVVGSTVASRDSELAEAIINQMIETAGRDKNVTELGGFEKVIEKAETEVSALIEAWDVAETNRE